MDQAILRGSGGCKTYMGVLSLQRWRGKVTALISSKHSTDYIVAHLHHVRTHTHTHTERVRQVCAHWGVLLSCTIKLIRTYACWTIIGQNGCDWYSRTTVSGCGTSSRVHQYSQQQAKHVAAPRCLSVVLILDKGEDNRRKRNQGGEGAHLFDMPSPHPSQNPSEARQEERKDNECVQVTTYVILVEPQAWCLIGYAAPNNWCPDLAGGKGYDLFYG